MGTRLHSDYKPECLNCVFEKFSIDAPLLRK